MKESRIKKLKIAVWLPLLALIIGAIFVAALVRGVRVENEKHAEKLERMNAETCSERMHGELKIELENFINVMRSSKNPNQRAILPEKVKRKEKTP